MTGTKHTMEEIGDTLLRLEIKRGMLREQKADLFKKIQEYEDHIKDTEEAQAIIQRVAQRTQEELEYQISEICSLAMAAVFDDPYELKVKFVIRRGKTECDILFRRRGNTIDPMDASGGGAVDIGSFSLRVSMWCISHHTTSPIFLIDEPFRFLSKVYIAKAGEMLTDVSKKLGIQIIMVSHREQLIESANNVIMIDKKIKKKPKLIKRHV